MPAILELLHEKMSPVLWGWKPFFFPNAFELENLARKMSVWFPNTLTVSWESIGHKKTFGSMLAQRVLGLNWRQGRHKTHRGHPWRRHISRFSISSGFSRLRSDWMKKSLSKGNLKKETQNIWHPSFLVEPGFPGSTRDKATPITQYVVKRIPQHH